MNFSIIESPATSVPLIVFSHLRWSYVFQRPQQLTSALSAHRRVLFVEQPVQHSGPPRIECRNVGPNLQVLVPHTPLRGGFDDGAIALLKPLLQTLLREQDVRRPIAWLYTPLALPLLAQLQPRLVVYDCLDEPVERQDSARQWHRRETALLKVTDLVLTSGPSSFEALRARHANVHHLPNAVDAEHFAPRAAGSGDEDPEVAAAAALQQGIAQPRLGFFGVVDERIDLELLDALAAAHPAWQLVMVGPVVRIDPRTLPRRANIHWLGQQPYARLPHLMAGWDVCLMPYAINASTRHISPTKTLEYMAGEKPVVSTAVSDVVSLYGDLVHVARRPREFIDACAAALVETPRQRGERLIRGVSALHRVSWREHARWIDGQLTARLQPRAAQAAVRAGATAAMPALAGAALGGGRGIG